MGLTPEVLGVINRYNGNAREIEATLRRIRQTEADLAVTECALTCAQVYGLNAIQLEDAIAKAVIMVWR